MRDNGIYITSSDAKLLIAAYDGDKDAKLDSKEFEQLVVPQNYHSLKMRCFGRREDYIGIRDKLHYDVEYHLSKLLKAEIDGLKDLHLERSLVKNRYDFSRVDAFRALDSYRINSLMREDLRSFMNKNGVYANAMDAENLIRRMDLDKDGRITYSEFCEFLEGNE